MEDVFKERLKILFFSKKNSIVFSVCLVKSPVCLFQEYRRQVQKHVTEMRNSAPFVPLSCVMGRAEDLWNTALLDASATVEVKAAQLDEVKQFHREMKVIRAFLQVLSGQKEAMSL